MVSGEGEGEGEGDGEGEGEGEGAGAGAGEGEGEVVALDLGVIGGRLLGVDDALNLLLEEIHLRLRLGACAGGV